MQLSFTKHEKISLKNHPGFSEKWLHDTIANDPSILGLGDVEVIDRERIQERSGRLDLMLFDGDTIRYEVEIMLGATDPSHVIRCIEYWDVERRRYPGYEHIAVLIAEDITSRFLNILSLMAGNIPLIAIQLNVLKVGEQLVLDFVHVLNQTSLRRDDEVDPVGQEVDRSFWVAKVGQEVMSIADGVLELVNGAAEGRFQLRYVKSHVGVTETGSQQHLIVLHPKKQYAHLRVSVIDTETWVARIKEAGLSVAKKRPERLRVTLTPQQFGANIDLLRELVKDALGRYQFVS